MWLAAAALAADIRGVTVSTETWGAEWGTASMDATLDDLAALGVNWVSIHPYARIRADGLVEHRPFDPDDPPEWLARPLREAHARGMKLMVTPHLAYWGSPFAWRGAITFGSTPSWATFFASYRRWVVALARAARDADAFVVGSELDGTIDHEAEWREVVAGVRAVYPGPLTYAANWDRFERVPFWDAVDVVGIQAYFPVTKVPDPDPAVLHVEWERIDARLHAFSQRTGKHVVFTELGYDAGLSAAAEPWARGDGGPAGERLQRDCLRAALEAIDREESVIGAFLWKWLPGDVGDFELDRPDLREVVRQVWGAR